ncbi:Leucine-rich repeat-containing protein 40 [Hondaea fermentalgiana]|uniref:Leucine-rich repeat-containing protein 40 n=1 Tax=Hondaea fermentalgiana TaxID=2315210 RepID=A0A2R5GHC2_9STRA|nr:Leucine-rich repeat-containing protein 40 [Hondaea fermentalgiana]|eukprot:GBG30307.1 Leucine-rich repeat-containing protein 40 [Hondaea fermentalgiana]
MLKFGNGCAADESWWDAAACTEIRLAGNKLRDIEVGAFEEICDTLSVVQLDNNDLEHLPEALLALETLRKLSISHNCIRALGSSAPWQDLVVLACSHNELEELPRGIADLQALRVLDVRHNRLNAIGKLPSGLEQLLASHNQIVSLGRDAFGSASQIQELVVSNNKLVRLEVSDMAQARVIDARQNALQVFGPLPRSEMLDQLLLGFNRLESMNGMQLANASKLTVLDLCENKIETLDEDALCASMSLKMLDLTNNNLVSLPPGLGYMKSLQTLSVIGNPLRGVRFSVLQAGAEKLKAYLRTKGDKPGAMLHAEAKNDTGPGQGSSTNMDPLQTLLWSNDRLRDAHARAAGSGILNLEGLLVGSDKPVESLDLLLGAHANCLASPIRPLVDLSLAKNAFPAIPSQISQPLAWASLLRLSLEENCIRHVDSTSFAACPSLEELVLRRNEIESFDLGATLTHLRILDLRQNKLNGVPNCIARAPLATSLEELLLGFNYITLVEVSLASLHRLKRLDLSNCGLQEIPRGLEQLGLLEYLNVENGNLRTIPATLAQLPRLQALLIAGNPQRAIRPHIVAEGSTALLEYLRGRCLAPMPAKTEAKESHEGKSAPASIPAVARTPASNVEEADLEEVHSRGTLVDDAVDAVALVFAVAIDAAAVDAAAIDAAAIDAAAVAEHHDATHQMVDSSGGGVD